MDEIAALELGWILLVVAAALGLGGNRRRHFLLQQRLDRTVDLCFVLDSRVKQADLHRPLPQEFARGDEFWRGIGPDRHRHAVHRQNHGRVGSSARVFGVRTIW